MMSPKQEQAPRKKVVKIQENTPRRRGRTRKNGIPDEQLPAIVAKLKAGATLRSASRALGQNHNQTLRTALKQYLGDEEYESLMRGRQGWKKKVASA